MSSKDSKSDSTKSAAKKTESRKPESKKTEPKKVEVKKSESKKPTKTLTFQGREVQIVDETKSRKGQDWDLIDLKFLDEDKVFRVKRKSLD